MNQTHTVDVLKTNSSKLTTTYYCIPGLLKAEQGRTSFYTYNSNTNNSIFTWSIVSGSISIVSGENSKIVTVKFGDDFTNGVIKCESTGDKHCNTRLEVNRKYQSKQSDMVKNK